MTRRRPAARLRAAALALALLALGARAAGAADDDPSAVDPDRPSISSSARTVPAGAAQIEAGVAYSYTRVANAPAERRLSVEATARIGVASGLELRLDGEPIVHLRTSADDTGVGDLSVGVKWRLAEADGLRPAIALLPFVKVPTATAPIGSTKVDGGLQLLLSFELPSSWGLDVNAGLTAVSQSSGGPVLQGLVTAALAHPLTERMSWFVEAVFASHAERGESDGFALDAGLAWSLTRRVSLDAAVLTTVAGKGPSVTVRLGVSARFGR